jgi:hypothetical protein
MLRVRIDRGEKVCPPTVTEGWSGGPFSLWPVLAVGPAMSAAIKQTSCPDLLFMKLSSLPGNNRFSGQISRQRVRHQNRFWNLRRLVMNGTTWLDSCRESATRKANGVQLAQDGLEPTSSILTVYLSFSAVLLSIPNARQSDTTPRKPHVRKQKAPTS